MSRTRLRRCRHMPAQKGPILAVPAFRRPALGSAAHCIRKLVIPALAIAAFGTIVAALGHPQTSGPELGNARIPEPTFASSRPQSLAPEETMAEGEVESGDGEPFEVGVASWYGEPFHGRLTANGERYDMNELTAAHQELPFGTEVKVVNRSNDRTVQVRINDRGPYVDDRIIDLSRRAAQEIKMMGTGLAEVELHVLSMPDENHAAITPPEEGAVTVQIGSYGTAETAERTQRELSQHGISAEIEEAGEVARVVVYNVPEDHLANLLDELDELGYPDPLVRRRR